ncbi:MAG: rRNA pseudouridine synthase [Clostridiales bacterium]|nr:rRNA pseudouridine synthase [Clostridiales bacterium]
MRINKYLASCELGSRRKVEEFILKGDVSVNGQKVTELGYDVKDADIVKYKGKEVHPQTNKVYIMLNKPKCYITSKSDEKDRRIVMDLVKSCKEEVFPVGRLDYNTEGLLLLTNDGEWANNITHPSKNISKTYEVKTKYAVTKKQVKELTNGIVIDDKRTLPAVVELMGQDGDFFVTHITIFEGRNREVRKMFEAINLKIYNLKRLSIGALELDDLQMGKFRYLNKNEINLVFVEK